MRSPGVPTSTQTWLSALERGDAPSIADRISQIRLVTAAQLKPLAEQLLALDSLQLVMSGEPSFIEPAIKANRLRKPTALRAAHE